MFRWLLILLCVGFTATATAFAQEGTYGPEPPDPNPPPRRGQPASSTEPVEPPDRSAAVAPTTSAEPQVPPVEIEIPPPEPINPREALFLAIELRDVEAARTALRDGADAEINLGKPSPLAHAALHNDVRMVTLLLSFGGNPGTTLDSPLEEAVRHENLKNVDLFLRSGARAPAGENGVELFRLAQRGSKARELSKALLDHGGNPNLCLAAATRRARIDVMKYCLSRNADVATLPMDLNILSVALRSEDSDFVGQVLGYGLDDRVIIGALEAAVTVGNMDVVQRAVASGAAPGFSDVKAAIENRQSEICLLLLDQTGPDDDSVLAGGDVAGLIQQADDLGLEEVSTSLRRKSGRSGWALERVLPIVLAGILALVLAILLVRNLGNSAPKVAISGVGPAAANRRSVAPQPPVSRTPEMTPAATPEPPAPVQPASVQQDLVPPAPAPGVPGPSVPAPETVAPAVAMPVAPATAAPEVAPVAVSPVAVTPVAVTPATVSPATVSPVATAPAVPAAAAPPVTGVAPATPAVAPAAAAPIAAPVPQPSTSAPSGTWEVAPAPATPATLAAAGPVVVAGQDQPSLDVRMPEVDLAHSADRVFAAARQSAASASQQPESIGRRSVALVTPSRVTMLYPCPVPGSLAAEQSTLAESLAPSGTPRNIAVIGYNELEAVKAEISMAIPFFELLRTLGYLGHAVWIFEGHVSAMAAGCQDADVLIVDDGMMRHLPGNWRSVAMRVMRGSDVYAFERRSGNLRRLK